MRASTRNDRTPAHLGAGSLSVWGTAHRFQAMYGGASAFRGAGGGTCACSPGTAGPRAVLPGPGRPFLLMGKPLGGHGFVGGSTLAVAQHVFDIVQMRHHRSPRRVRVARL